MNMEEKYREIFDEHEVTELLVTDEVQKYMFRKPDSGMYGFSVISSDNLLYMNGDIGPFLVTPGYGRNGLKFLRGSINSTGYFLEKVPYEFKRQLTVFSMHEAKEAIKEYATEDYGYLTKEEADKIMQELYECNGFCGPDEVERRYYELCMAHDIDEPSSPRVLSVHIEIVLMGLRCFLEKLDG